MPTFTSGNSVIANATMTVGNAATGILRFKSPATAFTLKVCVAPKVAGVTFPEVPSALGSVARGTLNWAVLADGEFSRLSNQQLTVNYAFRGTTAGEIAAKKLVAYTFGADGQWVRTELATTQRAATVTVAADEIGVEFSAPITAPGFFSIE